MEKTEYLYKVKEPTEGINYISAESKKLFLQSLQNNMANPFFELSDQFTTQTYGSYCGPTNILIILNAMGIDPGSTIFRNWKWYNENNIHACDIKSVYDHGMPITDMKYILEKNKVRTLLYRPICDINYNINNVVDISVLSDKSKFNNFILYEDICSFKYSTIKNIYLKNAVEKGDNFVLYNLVDENFFRICILASALYNNFYILCNIHRSQLGQEGGGHYLPIMAYNINYDYILLFDCARFKYNSRWHKVKTVFEAQNGKDRVTNLSRGFIVAIKPNNKNKFIITKDKIINLTKKSIENFFYKLNFNNIKDKAALLNWLIINEFAIEDDNILWNENKIIWEKTIPDIYKTNENFKSLIDFLFMFDRFNIKKTLLGCILFFNK
jgi:glutathione gamma-glutamylcysteinyltransferase